MLNHRTRRAAVSSCLALALAAPALSGQKTWTDPKHGFELRLPRDFNTIPISLDEKWVVAKFLYKRSLEGRGSEGDWWVSMPPEIRVIVFPKVDVKDVVEARKRREEQATKDGKVINLIDYLQNPFRNYEEYLRENYREGGWFVVEKKDTKIGGLPAVWKLMEVEDKAGSGAKVYLTAWEIDFGDAIYVVQCQCLKEHEQKFRGSFDNVAGSCKKIARTEALREKVTGGTPVDAETEAELKSKKELTPEERRRAREQDLARAKDKALSTLPEDWKSFPQGPFLVLYHCELSLAKKVADQAIAVWAWMGANFSFLGRDYAVGGIIRICKNYEEAAAYWETSTRSGYTYTVREVVLYDDKDWNWNERGPARLNGNLAQQFLADKSPRLWWSMPPWLDHGLTLYVASLNLKGGGLVAKWDEWNMEAVRERLREDNFKPSQSVLKADWEKFNKTGRSDDADRVQSLAIVHFLMEKGTKHPRYKTLIPDYLAALDKKLKDLEKEWKDRVEAVKSAAKAGKSPEEEENERWQADFRKKSSKIYDECFEKVFGSWSDNDWKGFEDAWRKAFKKG